MSIPILPGETAGEYQAFEVAWYRAHGAHPESRIKREHHGRGREYVIGDRSWNRLHPKNREMIEEIVEQAFLDSKGIK